jgi:Homeodomain-like domain-containing protein
VGYRGKVREQEAARRLRASGRTLQQIADELGVSKSSVSLWVRDVPFTPSKRRWGPQRRPNPASFRKQREIAECDAEGKQLVDTLSSDAFFAAGIALYAGEGAKTDGSVKFANTDPAMIEFFCAWLRAFFVIDESRLRVSVYLHDGLDADAARAHWSQVTGVPVAQFRRGYRAVADPSIRNNKHEFGCCYVHYCCTRTHRRIMGLVRALLSSNPIPG